MEIKLSVIIATYNSGKTLNKALNSVKRMHFNQWECIVIDGLSCDNTIEIVRKYQIEDSRFKYISEPDEGIYDALNKGLRVARGEWFYVLGSDDELLPDGIWKMISNSKGYDCVYGDVYLCDNKGKSVLFTSKPVKVLPTAICCSHQAIIMKREVVLALGGFDINFRISADYDLLLRAYLKGYRFYQTHEKIAYFANGEGASSHINTYIIKEQYRLYKKNKANKFPVMVVIWNFIKRLLRNIYDTKKKVE